MLMIFQIRNETDEEVAELRCSYRIRILVEELKWLLASADDHSITLDELLKKYEDHFGKTFDLESYGLLCMEDLKEKINGFIEVRPTSQRPQYISETRIESKTEAKKL